MNNFTRKTLGQKNLLQRLGTGLEIEFLGTSSASATFTRNVSSIALNFRGGSFLFDCGEGTSRQMLQSRCKLADLEAVFITHLHGDHYYGLPGIAMKLGNRIVDENKNLVEFIGPKGLCRSIGGMMIGRKIKIKELESKDLFGPIIYENDQLKVSAYPIEHSIFCVGYIIEEKTRAALSLNRDLIEREYGLKPGPLYKELSEGRTVTLEDGRIIDPQKVVNPRKFSSRKIVILGDTCNPHNLADAAYNADVLIHEATCSNLDRTTALTKKHSTAGMAGEFARRINAKNLLLTHFSPRENLEADVGEEWRRMQVLKEQAIESFGKVDVYVAKDFWSFDVPFNNDR